MRRSMRWFSKCMRTEGAFFRVRSRLSQHRELPLRAFIGMIAFKYDKRGRMTNPLWKFIDFLLLYTLGSAIIYSNLYAISKAVKISRWQVDTWDENFGSAHIFLQGRTWQPCGIEIYFLSQPASQPWHNCALFASCDCEALETEYNIRDG